MFKKISCAILGALVSFCSFAEEEQEVIPENNLPDIVYGMMGSIPGRKQVGTNFTEVLDAIVKSIKYKETQYNFAQPQDWKISWEALNTTIENTDVAELTNVTLTSGCVISKNQADVVRNSQMRLVPYYFDEVNLPNFVIDKWEIIEGGATIAGDVLTPTVSSRDNVIRVKGTASSGAIRYGYVPTTRWRETVSYDVYKSDAPFAVARKRVNDYLKDLLQSYRLDPTTNYHYTTWAEPSATHHYSNVGDRWIGQFGSKFYPYQHMGVNKNGDNSFWWAHAPVSKHVLIGAKHYTWNNSRILNGYEYFNYDKKFSGIAQVKVLKYYDLDTWAKDHGFEGTDANTGDLTLFVVEGEIPDECLPYIATADYLNATYGVDYNDPDSSRIPGISLNQANMVTVRSCGMGGNWGRCYAGGPTEKSNVQYEDGIVKSSILREDIYQLTQLGKWHRVVTGDSGHPTYIFDPALTTGLVDTDGTPLLRPILLSTYTSAAGGGGDVPRTCKIIKAFCEWVGDSLPYTLGDVDNAPTDANVIREHAKSAMEPYLSTVNED